MELIITLAAIAAALVIAYLVVRHYQATETKKADGVGGSKPRDISGTDKS